jgi:ABC-type multidrug transport system ATPase subunit
VFGRAVIGWKNIFRFGKWKRLFAKRVINVHGVNLNDEVMKFENVVKKYGDLIAVDSVSLSIKSSEIIIVIGPNGSGKSTLINCLIGAIEADSCNIEVFGELVEQDFEILYDNLGIVFQDDPLIDRLSVKEHLELFARLNGAVGEQLENDVSLFANMLDLSPSLNKNAKVLSGGEKRKLCLAIALLKRPSIIILDEVTSGLDVMSRQLVWKAISEFENMTGIISVHSVEEAESVCSRMLVLKKGREAFIGSAAELRNEYQCGYRLTFFDDNADFGRILEVVKEIVPEAVLKDDFSGTVMMPADLRTVDVLERIGKFGRFSIRLESLEETMRKLVEDEEAEIGGCRGR